MLKQTTKDSCSFFFGLGSSPSVPLPTISQLKAIRSVIQGHHVRIDFNL